LSFIHPGIFLAGILTVAIPVVIHLLFRQKPRRIEIGSIRFLNVALRDHVRRRRVRRWLLMALRIAGVVLLALLFARTYLRGDAAEGRDREVSIVIDRSASMAASSGGRSSFERAQAEAEGILKGLAEQTAIKVAYADKERLLPSSSVDRNARPGFAETDHAKALGWARDNMVTSTRRARSVYYLTDLQRTGAAKPMRIDWPEGVRVEVIDVGKPVAREVAVSDARVDPAEVRAGQPATIVALITNSGALPARNVPVRLNLHGPARPTIAAQSVTLEPGASSEVRFVVDGLKPGFYQGAVVAAPGDEFPLDDRRWVAFEARTAERILLVDGEPGASVYANETYYVETALRLKPPGQGASTTPYETVRVPREKLSTLPDLRGFSVVVACNVGDWSDGEASSLREFVASGGRLVLFGGRNVDAQAGDRLRRGRLVPAQVLGPSEPGAYRLATWSKNHPFFRALSDPQHGDLRRLVFRRITQLKPDPEARVLAATSAGEPLFLEANLGAGIVVVCAIAADRDWGDWPVNRLFLPLIHQVVGGLTGRLPEDQRIVAMLAGSAPDESPGVTVSGRSERSNPTYTVRNLAPAESDFERMTPVELRKAFHLPDPSAQPDREGSTATNPNSQRPDELWRYLVWGLFAVLLAEVFLANRTTG
jgi:hypothetical protein